MVSALTNALSEKNGWRTVEATASDNITCASEFIFNYEFDGGAAIGIKYRQLASLYTETAEKAYRIFTNDVEYEGEHNVKYINLHPNEEIEVDEALYRAFSLAAEAGSRNLFLAPIYEVYDNCFTCHDDSELVSYDPYSSDEVKEFFALAAAYANDSEMIDLELLGENRVMLKVSEEYLTFAEENAVESFIDFNWMKNAFIIDYIADTIANEGCTRGTISSYDGFVRTLDDSGNVYKTALYDRSGDTVYYAAELTHNRPMSMVTLRDFMINVRDDRYYEKQNGEMLTPYVDTADGMCRSSHSSMTFYSESAKCAELLLNAIPIYVTAEFTPEKLDALAENGIYSIYCDSFSVIDNGTAITHEQLYSSDEVSYTDAPAASNEPDQSTNL